MRERGPQAQITRWLYPTGERAALWISGWIIGWINDAPPASLDWRRA
ncbi:hypothetical protein [Haliangium sp. UPWRP_2]|nr:hypothetical protein [Haliangium sp. UPWRP_2]